MYYSSNELIMDLSELYGNISDKLRESYRKEFSKYSKFELLKIKDAIEEHHDFQKPPLLGKIFHYMKSSGIARKRVTEKFFMWCETCNTSFHVKSGICPVCAWYEKTHESEVIVKKALELPSGFLFINRVCISCKDFIGHKPAPRGARCEAMGSFSNTVKSGLDCTTCACRKCCNDIPKRNMQDVKKIIDRDKNIF